jgi:polysaccharide export outer membrane protein
MTLPLFFILKNTSYLPINLIMLKLTTTLITLLSLTLFTLPLYAKDYLIGGGDVLEISVWGNKDLSVSVPVRPDGKITLPLLGDLRASDLTPSELSTVIEEGLSQFISNPMVDVIVKKVNSHKVYVIGNGLTSGEYILNAKITLLQFLARLGNKHLEAIREGNVVTQGPDYHHAYLIRQGIRLKEGFHDLFVKGDISQDITLEPGDILYIPDNFINNIKVVGSVKNPGVVTYREGITILDAVLAVGGFDEFANEKELVIVRGEGDDKKEITVNMKNVLKKGRLEENLLLEPGDLIIVKESLF